MSPSKESERKAGHKLARGGALIFAVLRWTGWLGIGGGLLFSFLGAWEFSAWQGFSPDGPPPGFVHVPTPIFALLWTPITFFVMAVMFPWFAVPIFACVTADFVWRGHSRENRQRCNDMLDRRTKAVVCTLLLFASAWTCGWLYAYRTGPAEFCIQNHSSQTLENVRWQAESGTINVGRMLPLERRYFEFLPHAAREKVHLTFSTDGIEKTVDFTGGIDNTREYYFQYGVDEELRGTFGAWKPPILTITSVTVYNDSSQELHNVDINGLGWQLTVPTLAPNGSLQGTLRCKGPLIYALSFEAQGKRRAFNLWEGSGKSGDIAIRIPANLKPPTAGVWQPTSD